MGDENKEVLVPSASVALSRDGASSALARRGRQDLLARAEADEWYKRGLSLWGSNWWCLEDADIAPKSKARKQAAECFRRGLQLDPNHAALQFYLGIACSFEREPGEDNTEAVIWLQKAAEQGYADAQYVLGGLHRGGGSQEDAEAVDWYRKAAEQGNRTAQFNLGFAYANGQGVPQDNAQAVFWYRKAAEQGDAEAQCCLAIAYEEGNGVTQDFTQAGAWYRKAAEQGYKAAQHALDKMLRKAPGGEPEGTRSPL